jgi:GDP-L-fucose synthase
MCGAYNDQYGTNYISAMPTNLFGPCDNYDLLNSHALPALIRKMHEAKTNGGKEIVVWSTGTPRREFLYSDDLADACVFLMENRNAMDIGEFVNVGSGKEVTKRELAELVAQVIVFHGKLMFDSTKPDGTPRKLLDVSRLQSLGWEPKIGLTQGIIRAYADFLQKATKAA